jgi:energy-converting hydrogenase Eha subunit F
MCSSRRLTNRLGHQTACARPFCLALNGMALLVMLCPTRVPTSAFIRPQPGQHNIRAVPPPFYADPGRGSLFGKPVPTALTARLACLR